MVKKRSGITRRSQSPQARTLGPGTGEQSRAARAAGAEAGGLDSGPMNLALLEQLVRLMADGGLTSLELEDRDQRIALSKGGGISTGVMNATMPGLERLGDGGLPASQRMPSSTSADDALGSDADASRTAVSSTAGSAGLAEIKSPMVGTYYAAPSPDAKPFVQVGDRVGPDTDVCIIEAMKVFNNIKAETSGSIEKVLAESGQAVEYGQVLFLVRPT